MEQIKEVFTVVAMAAGAIATLVMALDRLADSRVVRNLRLRFDAATRLPQRYRRRLTRPLPYLACPVWACAAALGIALGLAFGWQMLKALEHGQISFAFALALATMLYAAFASGAFSASLRAFDAIRALRRRKPSRN